MCRWKQSTPSNFDPEQTWQLFYITFCFTIFDCVAHLCNIIINCLSIQAIEERQREEARLEKQELKKEAQEQLKTVREEQKSEREQHKVSWSVQKSNNKQHIYPKVLKSSSVSFLYNVDVMTSALFGTSKYSKLSFLTCIYIFGKVFQL